jgi:hypothetical protein
LSDSGPSRTHTQKAIEQVKREHPGASAGEKYRLAQAQTLLDEYQNASDAEKDRLAAAQTLLDEFQTLDGKNRQE